MASVTLRPHAFAERERVTRYIEPGITLGEMLDDAEWDIRLDKYTVITIDGIEIERPLWDERRLAVDEVTVVYLRPHGGGDGGDKQIYAAIAMIAIAVVAPYLAPALVVAFGGTAGVWAAGITIAGSLLVSAIFKPPTPHPTGDGGGGGTQYSLQAQSNQVTPYGAIPRQYGRLRVYPNVAAVPYSVNLQGANFLHALYDFGYGPLSIEDIRIGTTPLASYVGVDYRIWPSWVDGNPLQLYANETFVEGVSITLDSVPQQGTRVTAPNAIQAIIDLQFPVGLYISLSGGGFIPKHAYFYATVDGVPAVIIQIMFSRPGATGALGSGGVFSAGVFDIYGGNSRDPFGASVWIQFPPGITGIGTHTIMVERIDGLSADPSQFAYRCTWVQMRSISASQPLHCKVPHTILELRVRANDQLSGTIDTLSAIATSILPTWNGSTWVAAATRNPAWIYCDVLRGSAANRPVADAQIDLVEMTAWANECNTAAINEAGKPRCTCDIAFDYRATVKEALQLVAACGRAALTMRDGKFSVIRDVVSTAPVQLITKRNSWGLSATMPYLDVPHAINITYLNEASWVQETFPVYNDGYNASNATLFEELTLKGVVRQGQAWRFGRYFLAEGMLRRERATVTMDAENLVATRGDMVALAYDTMKVGGFPARIKSIIVNTITIDTPLESLSINALRVRRDDERGLSDPIPIINVVNETTFVADASTLSVGDLIVYGTSAVLVGQYLIDTVRPGPNFTASLDLVEYRPETLNADSGPIPARVVKPGLNPDSTLASPAPLLATVLYLLQGGRVYQVALTWNISILANLYRVLILEAGLWREIATTKDTRYTYTATAEDTPAGTVTYGVQAYSSAGVGSEIAQATITFDPDNDPWPSPTTPFNVSVEARPMDVEIRWDAEPSNFVEYYAVRMGPSWDDYWLEWQTKTKVMVIPPQETGAYSIWIKAVDPRGRFSTLPSTEATFLVIDPLQVSVIANAVANTAYLRWGSLSLGDPGWTAQTTHKIEYYEIAKFKTP